MRTTNMNKHTVRTSNGKRKYIVIFATHCFSGFARTKLNNSHDLFLTFTLRSFYIPKLNKIVEQL